MAKGGKRPGAGRKVGSKATHTVEAEGAKKLLIAMYIENIKPINEALLKKAKEGDMQAIKELHDRVYGRALTPIVADIKGDVNISFDTSFNAPKEQ